MTRTQYALIDSLRKDFSSYVDTLNRRSPWLKSLQDELKEQLGYADYEVETPIVYNRALDDIGPRDAPLFIIVADNPGKNEQKTVNQRYLVGQSGKLAKGWFAAELGLDFHKSCVIINKTPIHTPKTAELRLLRKLARSRPAEGPKKTGLEMELDALLDESQRYMAALAFKLHSALDSVLWVSGYGELSPGKLFSTWAEESNKLYSDADPSLREKFWVFKHFSMNQFAIEYKKSAAALDNPLSRLAAVGKANRSRILGW